MTEQTPQSVARQYTTRILRAPEEIAAVAEACARCRRWQKRPQADVGFEFAPSADDRYRVALLCDGDEIVGFAWVKVGEWRYPWRVALPGGARTIARIPLFSADYRDNDLIAPDDEEARRMLLRALLDSCADCSVLRLWFVSEDSDLWRLVRESRSRRAGRWIVCSWQPTPHWQAILGDNFEEYLRRFSARTRTKLRRRLRALGEAAGGDVAMKITLAREDVVAFLQQALEIAAKSSRPDAIRSEIGSTETARLLEYLADAGRLRCYTLTAGGKPVGFTAGWMSDDTYCMYRTGFDRQWEACSPGTSLVYLIIEDLHRLPEAHIADFGHGHWDYKQFFSSESYIEVGVYLVRPGVRSALTFVPVLFTQLAKRIMRSILQVARPDRGGNQLFRRGSQPTTASFIESAHARRRRP